MSQYYGDIQLGDTIQWLFTTVNTTPVPTVLTGSPTATAYTDGGLTQSATGVTITADFDSVVGLNLISVVATSGNGFAAGENIEIVLTAGTVGGNTVIGYAVGSFSVENRSNLRPTTVGQNEVDVTATGAVGIDWANIENQGTTVDLSATTTQIVDTATAVTTVNGLAANVITAAATAADHIDLIWDELMAGHVTADTSGLVMNDWQDAGRLDVILDARMAEASIDTTGGAVDLVTTTTAVTNDVGITATAVNLIWDEAMTETTGAPAVTASFREALKWMFALSRNRILQTATLTTLRNDADGGDLATSVVSDDATTYIRAEWST